MDGCGPEGWFTSTPYGTVDLLPVEAPQDVMDRYKAMIFLGWNSYDANDFLRIRDFVFKGGTLLLTAAHLNEELQPDQPVRFPADDAVIREMLGENYRQLTTKTEIVCGSGKIIYFPQKAYPAEMMLKADYVEAMKEIAAKAAGEKNVELIHVKDINAITGYIRGGCTPIGMKKQFPTVFHETAEILDTIMVSAGKIGFQVELSPADLIELVGGTTADVTV